MRTDVWNFYLDQKRKFHRLKKYALASLEVIYFSWCYQKMRNREFFKWLIVRIEKKFMRYEKSGKYCYISTHFAASTLGWLSLKPDLGHFQSLTKNFILRILRWCNFLLCGNIHYKKMPKARKFHETWPNCSVAKNSKSVSWYKARAAVILCRFIFLEADNLNCQKFWDMYPSYILKNLSSYREQSLKKLLQACPT